MKIGIAIFAYNRDKHLSKTLNGLKKNTEVTEIYVFQDGLKTMKHKESWERTRKVIESIKWCKVKAFYGKENKGLSRAIRDGINFVLQENDAIIVLEDDCVPTSNYISYMVQCFDKYKDNKRVYAINGYSRPVKAEKENFDVYFMAKFFSWGWGTWKDRWNQYAIDNDIWKRIRSDKNKSLYMTLWGGNSSERVFFDRLQGRNDSWAIYWSLKIFESEGVCVTPYDSFIQNIGCDGSGVHCGKTNEFLTVLENNKKKKYTLPDFIFFSNEISKSMISMYGGYTAINTDITKPHVLIYGLGNYFYKNEETINALFYVEAFIDMNKSGYYAGKKIIKPKDIELYQYNKIVIMIQSDDECFKVRTILKKEYNILLKKIILGVEIIGNREGQ